MEHYNYHQKLKEIWDKSVDMYQKGGRNANMFYNGVDLEFFRMIGANPTEMYDFVEDHCDDGEPDWEMFLLVQSVRRDYFYHHQHGKFSENIITEDSLPAKDDTVREIRWLPRILAKAKAKLRGELPTNIMYGCGGDRAFLKEHDVHPGDFLRAVWAFEDNDEALLDWFVNQSAVAAPPQIQETNGENPLS